MKITSNLRMFIGMSLFSLPALLHAQLIDCYTDINCNQQFLTCGQVLRNNSFESYGQISGTCDGNIQDACCWLALPNHLGTSDLINTAFPDVLCNGGTFTLDLSPTNSTGLIQNPPILNPFGNAQNGYAGFCTLDKSGSNAGTYREYICQQLTTPINNNESANISFQMTLSDFANRATPFHVAFVSDIYTGLTYAGPDDFISNIPASNYVTVTPDTTMTGWVTVNLSWTNTTGIPANYVIIGNLLDYSPTMAASVTTTPVSGPPFGTDYWCYYAIDDVSIEKTQTCCSNKDAMYIAYNNGTPASDDILMSSIYSTISNVAVNNIYIQGELIIDGTYTLTGKDITFGGGSRVTVQANKSLAVTNCHLHGCDVMWDGVYLNNAPATFTANTSTIEDAYVGVYVKSNSHLAAVSTTFVNDSVGIYYDSYTSPNSNLIRACTFKSTVNNSLPSGGTNLGYLLPPYNGRRSLYGIYSNSSSLLLRPTVAADKNYFQYLQTGIYNYNSDLDISNAEFAQIYNYDNKPMPLEHGIAIYSKSQSATLKSLTVSALTGQVKITNSDNGIVADGMLQTTISKNLIQGITYRAISHVSVPAVTASPAFQLNVTENTIKNAFEGIMYIYCGKTRSYTYKNTLQWLQEKKDSRGIIVEEKSIGASSLCSSSADGLPVQVKENTVTRFMIGISSSKATCMHIFKNTVTLTSPTTAQHHGMWLNESPFNVITTNNIYGNIKDWQCVGIRFWNSPSLQVGCNSIDNTGTAFFLDNDCSSSQFGANVLSKYSKGFLFVSSGKVGEQILYAPNFYSFKNQFDKTSNSLYEFVADQSIAGSNSIFHFWPEPGVTSIDIDTIHGAIINGSGTVILTSGTSSGAGYPGGGFIATMTPRLTLQDNATSTTTIGYDGCGAQTIEGDARMETSILENFTNGYYSNVEFSAQDDYKEAHEWMFYANTYQSYQLLKAMGYEEELSEVSSWMESFSSTDLGKFQEVDNLIEQQQWADALTLNQSIVPQTSYATQLQEANNLLITQWKAIAEKENYVPGDENAIENIVRIANLCLTEYGDAVLKARVFVRNHIDPLAEFTDACEVIYEDRALTTGGNGSESGSKNIYSVYPNPANNRVNLTCIENGEISYSVTDVLGKKIAGGTFKSNIELNIENWGSGIYFVTLNGEKTFRLVINK